jgi:hypothetical protein
MDADHCSFGKRIAVAHYAALVEISYDRISRITPSRLRLIVPPLCFPSTSSTVHVEKVGSNDTTIRTLYPAGGGFDACVGDGKQPASGSRNSGQWHGLSVLAVTDKKVAKV